MLNVAGQGLIGGFWKLASYGIGSRSQRKHRGILVWQSLIGQFYIHPYLTKEPHIPY